ncbi:unnamed protein product [Dovyalis caffra]|uniref:Uncharacterized protein n=1 Tax=Dovyalis caffra TaxID=77055 RepID=A0AAV1RI99_9ROSI|nr:unnamed protein product [Dovyalis caffra]
MFQVNHILVRNELPRRLYKGNATSDVSPSQVLPACDPKLGGIKVMEQGVIRCTQFRKCHDFGAGQVHTVQCWHGYLLNTVQPALLRPSGRASLGPARTAAQLGLRPDFAERDSFDTSHNVCGLMAQVGVLRLASYSVILLRLHDVGRTIRPSSGVKGYKLQDGWPGFDSICLPIPEGGFPFLEIIECHKLVPNRMQWHLQSLSSLSNFKIGPLRDAESFPEKMMLPSSLTSLTIWGLLNLTSLDSKELQNLTHLRKLEIVACSKLETMPDEGLPSSLSSLAIWGCPLQEERLKNGEDLDKISHVPNIEINVSKTIFPA